MQFMTVQEAVEIHATVEDKADTAAICADCHRAPLRIPETDQALLLRHALAAMPARYLLRQ
jgi:cytochrome c553